MTSQPRPTLTSPVAARRRVGFAAALAGAAATGVAAHNALRIRRVRRDAVAGDRDHAATVGEGLGDALSLVVCGDSAADGFGIADAREAFPFQTASALAHATGRRVRVSALAVNGARTADVTTTQVPRLRALDPDVVVVSIGVNDAVARRAPKEVRADTVALLDAVASAVPDAQVVLVTCPDLGVAPGIPRPLRDLLGWSCRRVATAQQTVANRAGIAVAPLDVPGESHLFGDDGFHPGPPAQALMAHAAVAALLPDT